MLKNDGSESRSELINEQRTVVLRHPVEEFLLVEGTVVHVAGDGHGELSDVRVSR